MKKGGGDRKKGGVGGGRTSTGGGAQKVSFEELCNPNGGLGGPMGLAGLLGGNSAGSLLGDNDSFQQLALLSALSGGGGQSVQLSGLDALRVQSLLSGLQEQKKTQQQKKAKEDTANQLKSMLDEALDSRGIGKATPVSRTRQKPVGRSAKRLMQLTTTLLF